MINKTRKHNVKNKLAKEHICHGKENITKRKTMNEPTRKQKKIFGENMKTIIKHPEVKNTFFFYFEILKHFSGL